MNFWTRSVIIQLQNCWIVLHELFGKKQILGFFWIFVKDSLIKCNRVGEDCDGSVGVNSLCGFSTDLESR